MPSLARSSLLQITGKILGVFFGLATFYLLLHVFGTDGYGVFTTALTYVTLFSVIVDFGLTITTTQMISEHGADEKRILGNLFSLRVVSALFFMALAPLSAFFIPQNDNVFPLICIASVTYFFSAIGQMFLGVFQKRLSLVTPVIAEMVGRLVAMAGVILVGVWQGSLWWATAAFTLGSFLNLVIMLAAAKKYVDFSPQFDVPLWKEIIRRSSPIGLSIFFNLLYLKGDILFMWFLGRSDWEIGQYGSAYKVVDVLTMIPVTFMGLLLPMLTNAWSGGDKEMFMRRLQQTFDVFCIVAIPCMFGAWVLGVPLMEAVKSDLTLAGQLLWVLIPAAVVVFFGSLYGHVVVAVQAQRRMLWNYLLVALLGIVSYWLLIDAWGAWGAALTTLVCESAIAILAFSVIYRSTTHLPSLKMLWRVVGASVVMTIILLALRSLSFGNIAWLQVVVLILIGGIVYVMTLGRIGGPTVKDIRKLLLETPPSNRS